jgi:hypothetical protein
MRDHPLTPMTDANLVRVLQAQTRRGRPAALRRGGARRRAPRECALQALAADGVRLAVADAIDNADLRASGRGLADAPLVTAGSGVAIGLPQNFGARLAARATRGAPAAPGGRGGGGVSGSCSVATNARWQHWLQAAGRRFRIDPLALAARAPTWPPRRWPGPRRLAAGAGAGLRHRRARRGQGGAGRGWASSAPARWWSTRWPPWRARWYSAACAGWWWPAARPRARWCRRWACTRCASAADRPRRALDRTRPGADRPLLLALKSGNFGSDRLLHQGAGAPSCHDRHAMTETRARDLPRRPLAVRARLRARHRRQHQRAAARWRRLPDHAHRRLPGHARPARLAQVAADGSSSAGDRASKTLAAAPAHLRRRARGALRDPHPQHPPGGADAGRRLEPTTSCRRSRPTS